MQVMNKLIPQVPLYSPCSTYSLRINLIQDSICTFKSKNLKLDGPKELLRCFLTGPEYLCQVQLLISLLRAAQDRGVPEGECPDEGACTKGWFLHLSREVRLK